MCAIHFPLRVVLCIWEQIKVMCHPRCISNTALVDVYKCLVKMSKMSKNTYENTMKCRCIFCLGSLFSSLYSCQLVRTPLISPASLTFPEIIMGFWHDVSINVPRVIVFWEACFLCKRRGFSCWWCEDITFKLSAEGRKKQGKFVCVFFLLEHLHSHRAVVFWVLLLRSFSTLFFPFH